MPTRLAELGAGIEPPTARGGGAASGHGVASGVAGRLAQLRDWLAAIQSAEIAREPRRARLLYLGRGGGCPEAAAELAQLSVREVPVTVVAPVGAAISGAVPSVAAEATAAGSAGSADPTDSGISAQLAAGVALADAEVDSGTDLLVLSVPDMEVLGPALICVITGIEPVKLLPRGARLDVAEWTRRALAVRDARRALVGAADDPDELLAAACRLADDHATAANGEPCRLAVACGLLLHASARRTPVLLDGVGAAAVAALCAQASPSAATWWRAAELGADPAYDAAMAHIAVEPVLPVAAGGADGVAGALAVLTLRMAVRTVKS